MNTDVSLLSVFNKYNEWQDGKAVDDASNIRKVLKNKIQSGLAAAANGPQETPSAIQTSQTEKKPGTVIDYSYPAQSSSSTPVPLSLVNTEMNVAFPEHQYIPSCFDSACNAFVKLVFQYEQTVVMEDIPLTATCREVRNYLVQKSLFPILPSLTGWRLLFSSVILDDDMPISTYSLPQCARIQICRIDEEETPTLPKRPYLNAATTPAIPLPNGAKRVLLRTIEHSKEVAPSSVVLVAPTEATVREEAAVVTKPVEYEDDYFPVLRREGYYMRPSHFDMRELSKEQLQHLRRFTVGREGAGEICWEGETDVTYLNLDERVLIERDLQGIPYVHVYPPELFMNVLPPVGSELNKTATVRLFNMFPRTARSESGLQRYADMLRRQVEAMGAEWIGYNGDQGIMEFRIQH
ncbi:hypothetical protein WA556_002718, partial [Blastocystis sp. ATCC 50177/Nand II]